ncbi:helix-turn-helix transcriptional regulator [Endozoicomonas lisbonensis]|uniref:helix-turn-helix transcriptional regulator n=1 Tax=Endozoicomonas lisbonensis TaxID=3120522 RepID=UPI003395F4E8
MSKRSSALDTTILILELLKRIPKNWSITAQELQQQLCDAGFSRDIHTIQRHLKTLVESSHFNIDLDDRSKPYGYRWSKNAKGFTANGLSIQESLILRMAEEYLKNLLPSSLMGSMAGFFEEANRNISQTSDPQQDVEWLSKVIVAPETQPLLPPELQEGVFDQVSKALYGNYWLHLTYKNAAGSIRDATVMPLGLAQQGPRLYVVCRFKGYEDDRVLALHRIQSAESSTLTFDRPEEFDLKQFSADGRFTFGRGEKVRLTFSIQKSAGLHILETRLSEDQQHTECDDFYEITATVVRSAQLEWWLGTFGDRVKDIVYKPA